MGSAGGLDAVSRVLGRLPPDFAASVIVLIHQAPDRENALISILRRASMPPVVRAEHDVELARGQVIVVPPGKHLLITREGRTALIVSGARPPNRPSADLLLATLATALGPRAIAVVLSGGGRDGATGATAIDACGGTVLATDEASSQTFSMPQATIAREPVVDGVLALDDVADLLVELVTASRVASTRPRERSGRPPRLSGDTPATRSRRRP